MLVLLLFDGGVHIGCDNCGRRTDRAAGRGGRRRAHHGGIAVLAHLLLDFDWRSCLLWELRCPDRARRRLLGPRPAGGLRPLRHPARGGVGADDRVGIAAMAALCRWREVAAGCGRSGVGEFALERGWGCSGSRRGLAAPAGDAADPLPSGALYPLQSCSARARSTAPRPVHGSGFLAVFVAGIVLGDVRAPYKAEIERFHSSLASLAEMVASPRWPDQSPSPTWAAGALALRADPGGPAGRCRPLLVGLVLFPVDLTRGERY